ncbi:MAG: hypothetical protein GW780_02195, partial [Candidatus Aenigmarchaeota archaeon]|nr:hypothetical protein [Candidatus Aenigmarchaeota archaeon]
MKKLARLIKMLEMALRNVFRQKTRTALTVVGIMIGIAAIVALGSISEGLRVQIAKSLEQSSGLITVIEKSDSGLFMSLSSSELSQETVDEVMAVSGIKDATPVVYKVGYLEGDSGFGEPSLFEIGVDPEKIDLYTTEGARLAEGETLDDGDTEYVMAGSKITEKLDLKVGDTVAVEEKEFIVKGIYEEFGNSGLDSGIIMPLDIAKELFETDKYSSIIIYPDDINNVEDLAKDIEDTVDGVSAITTAQFAKQIGQIVDQIGFPLVTKPVNGNHGRGVTININNFQEALNGFNIAQKISSYVLVERQITGEDYRLLVINNKLVAASKRTPAHVVGDGKSTIKKLIDKVNEDPRRGYGHEKMLTLITIDKITKGIISSGGYTLKSVLKKGEKFILK